MTDRPRPFCDRDKAATAAFDLWVGRLETLGVELQDADAYVVGLLASREARLEGLVAELRREKDGGRRLRLLAAERLAAQDMAKALDQAERVFGAVTVEDAVEQARQATGTDGANVIAFASKRGPSPVAQRIAATVAKASRPLTKDALRRRVSGAEGDFLRGLREAVDAGTVIRTGHGRKGSPYVYGGR